MEESISPTLRWGEEEDLESIGIVRKDISRLLRCLEPCKECGLDEVFPYELKEQHLIGHLQKKRKKIVVRG